MKKPDKWTYLVLELTPSIDVVRGSFRFAPSLSVSQFYRE